MDYSIAMIDRLEGFLKQPTDEKMHLNETIGRLKQMFAPRN